MPCEHSAYVAAIADLNGRDLHLVAFGCGDFPSGFCVVMPLQAHCPNAFSVLNTT